MGIVHPLGSIFLLTVILLGCGQKGALYLSEDALPETTSESEEEPAPRIEAPLESQATNQ